MRPISRSGRGPKGWADDGIGGSVDGQTPQLYDFLKARGRWPKRREIKLPRVTSNQVVFPFALRAIR